MHDIGFAQGAPERLARGIAQALNFAPDQFDVRARSYRGANHDHALLRGRCARSKLDIHAARIGAYETGRAIRVFDIFEVVLTQETRKYRGEDGFGDNLAQTPMRTETE